MDVNNQLKMVLIGIDPSTYKLKNLKQIVTMVSLSTEVLRKE